MNSLGKRGRMEVSKPRHARRDDQGQARRSACQQQCFDSSRDGHNRVLFDAKIQLQAGLSPSHSGVGCCRSASVQWIENGMLDMLSTDKILLPETFSCQVFLSGLWHAPGYGIRLVEFAMKSSRMSRSRPEATRVFEWVLNEFGLERIPNARQAAFPRSTHVKGIDPQNDQHAQRRPRIH